MTKNRTKMPNITISGKTNFFIIPSPLNIPKDSKLCQPPFVLFGYGFIKQSLPFTIGVNAVGTQEIRQ